MTNLVDLNSCQPTWCPGCGNFGTWAAFKNAAVSENWNNTNTVLTAGIGCHGHIINYIKLTSFESLHGRSIPVATGIKLANHKLNVFSFTGDGDCLGEGGNHFLHVCRRNHDQTVIIHDNAIYGLTTGQTSPRSPYGYKSKSTPFGNLDQPLSPIILGIAAGATFVARAFSQDIQKLTDIIIQANKHKGISIIDVLQPCITFNKEYSYNYFKENCYYLDNNHDFNNKETALKKALEWGDKQIPLGVFYKVEKPSYESLIPQIKDISLVNQLNDSSNLKDLFEKYI